MQRLFLDCIDVSFPGLHVLDKEKFPGIAKFPIDAWERCGIPYLSTRGWCEFCIKIAQHDMENLGRLLSASEKVKAQCEREGKTNMIEYFGKTLALTDGPAASSSSSSAPVPEVVYKDPKVQSQVDSQIGDYYQKVGETQLALADSDDEIVVVDRPN